MRDLHPVADCWVQMLMIKKKIKQKSIKLNRCKLQGRKRLESMRKLRDEQLNNLQTLINVKLKKIRKLSKKKEGRMKRTYTSWLRKWHKYLKIQQIKLMKMEKKENELDRQLFMLRKQLGILPNRRHVLIKYLRNFERALNNTENVRKEHSQKNKDVMNIELKNIISFLVTKERDVYRYGKPRIFAKRYNIDIPKFWKNQLRQRKFLQSYKPKKSVLSIGSLGSLGYMLTGMPTINELYHMKNKKLKMMAEKKAKGLRKLQLKLRKTRDSLDLSTYTGSNTSLTNKRTDVLNDVGSKVAEERKDKENEGKEKEEKVIIQKPKGNLEMETEIGTEIGTEIKIQSSSSIDELMKNKSVPAGIHTYRDKKSPHWKLFQRILVSKEKKRVGSELMKNLESSSQTKLVPIQNLLKDVIKGPTMLDILADREEILKTVGRHYMWKNMTSVYYDLVSFGVPEPEIFSTLREQYLRYIDNIVAEAIEKGAKVVSHSQVSSVRDQKSIGESSDSFEEYLNRSGTKEKSTTKTQYVVPLEIMDFKEILQINRRYSATNLRKIHDAHVRYFNSLNKSHMQCKLQEEAIARDLRRNSPTDSGRSERIKKRKSQKKVDFCRLYYEPRKTCRERSIQDDNDEEIEDCSCVPEHMSSKCARCGVELSPTNISPKSSFSGLSLCSLAECGKSKELLQFTSDIYSQHSPCSMHIETTSSRTMQQLRTIKQISQCSDRFSLQSSLRDFSSLQRICS